MKIRMLLLTLLIAFLLLYAFAGYSASSLVIGEHPEWRKLIAQPADFGLTAEVVSFDSTDGTPLKAWWLPAQAAALGNVVLAHGRDANRSRMLPYAAFLVRHRYNVLAVDLRDHGESGGKYITSGYLEACDILLRSATCAGAAGARPSLSWAVPTAQWPLSAPLWIHRRSPPSSPTAASPPPKQ